MAPCASLSSPALISPADLPRPNVPAQVHVTCGSSAGRSRKQKVEVDHAHAVERLTVNGRQYISKQVHEHPGCPRKLCAQMNHNAGYHCALDSLKETGEVKYACGI